MKEERDSKCAKCGSSPADDPTVLLHRFPQPNKANKSRCELWAKFCFPDEEWQSPQFQNKLFTEHKMLCDKHFKSTSFEKEKRLSKFSMSEKDCDKDSLDQKSLVSDTKAEIIKTESDEKIIQRSIETRSRCLQRIAQQIVKINNSPKQRKDSKLKEPSSPKCPKIEDSPQKRPEKRRAEGQDEINYSPKKKDTARDNETQDMSQDEFDDTCNEWFGKTYERNDDCELYGKLLTKKLRTYAVYERNLLMFKIDGLLIEHPPGFDPSAHSYSISTPEKTTANASNKTTRKQSSRIKSEKASATPEIAVELNSYCNSDKVLLSSTRSKKKKVNKEPLSQTSTDLEESSTITTQVTSTSMPLLSPFKMTNDISKQPVKVTSNLRQPIKVTTSIQHKPIKVTKSIPQPMKVTSSMPNQPVKVISIPNKPVKGTTISNQSSASQASSVPVPSHLPLQITIPQSKVLPYTQSKFVASATHPKGKIVIMSKSAKYVPSSQPPILITVPSLPGHSPVSTQCDMNSLEQLSSIAATHASQSQYEMTYDIEGNEMVDDINVVSNEVILATSEDSPSRNIVEIALKNTYLDVLV